MAFTPALATIGAVLIPECDSLFPEVRFWPRQSTEGFGDQHTARGSTAELSAGEVSTQTWSVPEGPVLKDPVIRCLKRNFSQC